MGGIRYKTTFDSLNGIEYEVKIWDGNISGSLNQDFQIGPSGPVIKYDSAGEDKFNEILPSSCELEFIINSSSDQTFWQNSFRSSTYTERDIYIIINQKVGGSFQLLWSGYVLQDLGALQDVSRPFSILLKAVDGLSVLKEIPFVPNAFSAGSGPFTEAETYIPAGTTPTNADSSWGSGTYHRLSFYVAEILGYAGIGDSTLSNSGLSDYNISISANWYNEKMSNSDIASNDTFFLTAINAKQFYKQNSSTGEETSSKFVAMNCYDALKNMMRCFGSRIFYWGGTVYVIQPGLYGTSETGTNSTPDNIDSTLYNKAGVKQTRVDFVGNNSLARYKLSTQTSRPTTPGEIKKLTGTIYDEYPIYKKVVTTFPSISNENLFTEFPLQEGVTANPRTFLNSNSHQLAQNFTDIGQFVDPKDYTGFFIQVRLAFSNATISSTYMHMNWTIQAKPASESSWYTSNTLVPVKLTDSSGNVSIDWIEAVNFSTFNPTSQNITTSQPYGLASAVPAGSTAKNPFKKKEYVFQSYQQRTKNICDNTDFSDDFNNILPLKSTMSGSWDFRFFHVLEKTTFGARRHFGHGCQNTNPFSSLSAGGKPPFASVPRSTGLQPTGDAGDVFYQNVSNQATRHSVFAIVSGGSIGSFGSQTNLTSTGNQSYVKSIPATLWGDTSNTNAPGSLYVQTGTGTFAFTDIIGEWEKGGNSGNDSLTELLCREVLSHNNRKTFKGNFTFALSAQNRDIANNTSFPRFISPLTKIFDTEAPLNSRPFVMLNASWNLMNNEVSGAWWEYLYVQSDTTPVVLPIPFPMPELPEGIGSNTDGNGHTTDGGLRNSGININQRLLSMSGPISGFESTLSNRILGGNMIDDSDEISITNQKIAFFTVNSQIPASETSTIQISNPDADITSGFFKSGDKLAIITDGGIYQQITLTADVATDATSLSVSAFVPEEIIDVGAKIYLDEDDLFQQYQRKTSGTVAGFSVDSDGLTKGGIEITGFLDSDTMSGTSANTLPTSESVKAYVDAQVATSDTLQEVTDNGNTTTNTIGADAYTPKNSSSPIKFESTSGTEHARITDGGTLLINSTSVTHSNNPESLRVFHNNTDTTNSSSAVVIDANISGSSAIGGDTEHAGLNIDLDSSATGGDTVDEHRVRGIKAITTAEGDSDQVYGILTTTIANHSSGTISALRGIMNFVKPQNTGNYNGVIGGYDFVQLNNSSVPNISSVSGARGEIQINGFTNTVTTAYGGFFKIDNHLGGGTISTARGVYSEIEIDTGTISNARAFEAVVDINGGTLTNSYMYRGSISGSPSSDNFGLYLIGVAKNRVDGFLGIGKTPSIPLDVFSDENTIAKFNSSDDVCQLQISDNDTTFFFGVKDGVAFISDTASGPASGLQVDGSGNVGIGVAPTQKLDVQGNIQISNTDASDGDTIGYLNFHNTTGGSTGNHARISAIRDSNSAGQLVFHTKVGGGIQERMRITSSGNVGIGNSSPAYKLDVTGKIQTSDRLLSNQLQARTSFGMVFKNSAGSDLMFMSNSGNLGISNTNPYDKLQIGNSDSAPVFGIDPNVATTVSSTTNDDEVAYQLYVNDGNNNIRSKFFLNDNSRTVGFDTTYSTDFQAFVFKLVNSEVMRINSSGNVLIGTTGDSGEKLQVAGNVRIKSSDPNLIIEDTNGRSVEIDVTNNTFRIDDVGNNAAIFTTDLSTNPTQTTFFTTATFQRQTQFNDNINVSGTIANDHFTIPNASGSAGQVLKYPSSGSTLEWGTVSGGATQIKNYSLVSCETTVTTSVNDGESYAVVIPYDTEQLNSSTNTILLTGSGLAGVEGSANAWYSTTQGDYEYQWNVLTDTSGVNNRILTGVKLQRGVVSDDVMTWSDYNPSVSFIYDRGTGNIRKGSTSNQTLVTQSDIQYYWRLVAWKEESSNADTTSVTVVNGVSLIIKQIG